MPSYMKTAAGRANALPAAVYFSRGRAILAGRGVSFSGKTGETPAPGGAAYKKCCTFSLRRGMITYHNRGGSPQRAARRCAPSRARGVERFLCVSARSALYITQRQEEWRRAGACGERVPGSGLPDSAGARTKAADRRPSPGETGPEGSRRTAPPIHAPHDPGAGAAP